MRGRKTYNLDQSGTMSTYGARLSGGTLPAAGFAASVASSRAHIDGNPYDHARGATCCHPFSESWKLNQCMSCGADLGPERLAAEKAAAARASEEDADVTAREHALKLWGMGVRVDWLVSFTFAHNCWDWPTWRVVRDIVKPATQHRRCRYAQLADVSPYTGQARVFMSHCWGAPWGNLVHSATHGARTDRFVWIDVFAVRQWAGNEADLNFRGVIANCTAVVVSVSTLPGLTSFGIGDAHAAWLASADGEAAKKVIAFFRLWCVVELAAAVQLGINVIIKVGTGRQQGGERVYDISNGEFVLSNLLPMINVEAAQCAVRADYTREMKIVRDTVGVDKVNEIAKGVVLGGLAATAMCVLEVDAAVCGDPGALESIPPARVVEAIRAAAAGGRMEVLKTILTTSSLDMMQRRDLEGYVMFLRQRQPKAAQILKEHLSRR